MPELLSKEDINYLRDQLTLNMSDDEVWVVTCVCVRVGLFDIEGALMPCLLCTHKHTHIQAADVFTKELNNALNNKFKRFDNTMHILKHG